MIAVIFLCAEAGVLEGSRLGGSDGLKLSQVYLLSEVKIIGFVKKQYNVNVGGIPKKKR